MFAILVFGAIGLAVLALLLMKRGTLYFLHGSGFTASGAREPTHRARDEDLPKVVESFLRGDLFDMLWVSRENDEYGGLNLILQDGVPVLSADFRASERDKVDAFKETMSRSGFEGSEDSNGFNGGFGEKYRVTDIEFALPISVEAIVKATHVALDHLQGTGEKGLYLNASWLSVGTGTGFKFQPVRDPLKDVLNAE